MSKRVISVTIDEGIYTTLRTRNENISKIINEYLSTYSGVSREQLEKARAVKELEKTKARLVVLEENLAKLDKEEQAAEKKLGVPFKIGP